MTAAHQAAATYAAEQRRGAASVSGETFRGVTQTRTGFPSGNCTEAAIASILGVPLNAVPQLWSGRWDATTDVEAQPAERMTQLLRWLDDRGLVWLEWRLAEPLAVPFDVASYSNLRGFEGNGDAPHLLAGTSPSGLSHMVVGQGGRVLWDPNPRRLGVTSVSHVGQLQRLNGRTSPLQLLSEDR